MYLRFWFSLSLLLCHAVPSYAEEILLACIDSELRVATARFSSDGGKDGKVVIQSNESNLTVTAETQQQYGSVIAFTKNGVVVFLDGETVNMKALFADGTSFDMRCNQVSADLSTTPPKIAKPKLQLTGNQCGGNMNYNSIKFDEKLIAVNQVGEEVSLEGVISKPTLVYFGYSFCPDVCPLDVVRNDNAISMLRQKGIDAQQVFITVDPERDSPEVLAAFLEPLDNMTVGLTGNDQQIKDIVKSFRAYAKAHKSDDEYYLVDHSTMTYLVLPKAGLADYFNRDWTETEVAEIASCHINSSN